ncbi:MAG: TRIC cation channel family protein [Anaerovoracaceae bacterium]
MEFITIMEWVGTVAFAVSGAVVAIEKGLDYYGICFLAIITAIGGGIIRDTIINVDLPVGLANPIYVLVSIATAVVVIIFYKKIVKYIHIVAVADGIGLAAFTAIGSQVAVRNGFDGFYVIITLAVLTGTFGGVLRDICVKEIPAVFHTEIYAVASIIGAMAFAATYKYYDAGVLALYVSFAVTVAIRMIAIFKKLNLGKVKLD